MVVAWQIKPSLIKLAMSIVDEVSEEFSRDSKICLYKPVVSPKY